MSEADPVAGLSSLLPFVDRFATLSVWVIGDLILDEYVVGPVERISPEAPVPIVRVRGTEYRLGGAANVARQVRALGAGVLLAGVVGDDEDGARLLALCDASKIDTSAIRRASNRQTTRKMRVLAGHQQLMRLDWEDRAAIDAALIDDLLLHLKQGTSPDAIIVSDYAKGVLTPRILEGIAKVRKLHGCPMIVDPKHADFQRYRGATHLTPNHRELEAAVGYAIDPEDTRQLTASAQALSASVGLEGIVVTRGERGMLVVPTQGSEAEIVGAPRSVFDITGAGDTAVAVLGLALAAHAPLEVAAQLANVAGGLSVEEVGTVAIESARFREALTAPKMGKVLSSTELATKAATWHLNGQRIVFTNGCFDLLHAGHLSLLQQATRYGDKLVVAINSDASVRRLKGPSRPLVTEADRAAILSALTYVDAVTIFEEDTPLQTLERVMPHILVKGSDYRLDDVIGKELVESKGGRVVLVPLVPERSTTSLIERLSGTSSAL